MVASFLEPTDYDNPEDFVVTPDNTITHPFKVSERYPTFEVDYVNPALKWWETYVETGISPDFDEKKDADILKELRKNSLSPDTDLNEIIAEAETLQAELDKLAAESKDKEKRLKALKCAWQNLPLDLAGWHAADGQGNGNRKTIAIECIMSNRGIASDKNSEDNCARLAAYLLHKYGLDIDRLYTHTHWLNVKAGKKGSVDELNTMKNSYKNCPAYILPHWSTFKAKVKTYLDALNGTKPVSTPTTPATQTKPTTTTKPSTTKKSDDEIAKEVIEGKWGNGEDRKKRLTSAGYNYNTIQRKVNALLSKPTPTKSITEIAKEVINGKWGNGSIRKQRLTKAGYDYDTVQREVNRLLK